MYTNHNKGSHHKRQVKWNHTLLRTYLSPVWDKLTLNYIPCSGQKGQKLYPVQRHIKGTYRSYKGVPLPPPVLSTPVLASFFERNKYQDLLPNINPLSLNSDQYQISPCNINVQSIREVMRIKDMII